MNLRDGTVEWLTSTKAGRGFLLLLFFYFFQAHHSWHSILAFPALRIFWSISPLSWIAKYELTYGSQTVLKFQINRHIKQVQCVI